MAKKTATKSTPISSSTPFVGGMGTTYSGPRQPPRVQHIATFTGVDDPKRPNPNGPGSSTTTPAATPAPVGDNQDTLNAIATVQGLFAEYGLTSLYGKIVDLARKGYGASAIALELRNTDEYKARFPAMAALNAKGRGISEAAYIEYEVNAKALERRYGLPTGMVTNSVTTLLTNEVSADELNSRVVLSSAAAVQAPQEFKDQMKKYYNIDSGGLAGYFLDPNLALPLLEKQYASTIIGTEASRQEIDLGLAMAEELQGLGVTQEEARTGFGTVAGAKDLSVGRGDVVSQEQMIKGTLGKDQSAQQQIERASQARVNRFQGGGQFTQTQQGTSGLGSAATR